jgi:hypothetical protein
LEFILAYDIIFPTALKAVEESVRRSEEAIEKKIMVGPGREVKRELRCWRRRESWINDKYLWKLAAPIICGFNYDIV